MKRFIALAALAASMVFALAVPIQAADVGPPHDFNPICLDVCALDFEPSPAIHASMPTAACDIAVSASMVTCEPAMAITLASADDSGWPGVRLVKPLLFHYVPASPRVHFDPGRPVVYV